MKHIVYFVLTYLGFCTATQANCVPPMQTLFACDLEGTDARVEFCHEIAVQETSNSSSVPGKKKSYSFARGTEPAELYFIPTDHFFDNIDATRTDKKIHGYEVNSFLV